MPRRGRLLISICLLIITALAWVYLIHLDGLMSRSIQDDVAMAAMGMATNASWTLVDVWFAFVMWLIMMIGMMTPVAAPVLFLFAATAARHHDRGTPRVVVAFALGHVAVWAGFSACAALAQWVLHQAALLSSM